MATDPITGGFRPVTLPNQFPPMPAIARILSRFDRAQLEGFISVAIDLADAMDGDADDAEDDDPAGGDIVDEPHDPQGDYDSGALIPGGGSGI